MPEKKIDFTESADCVAKMLLGKVICRKISEKETRRFIITETEAYCAKRDKCICYGYNNEKKKNKSGMFYSVGMWCAFAGMLMISCGRDDNPDNVLIRRGVNLDSFIEFNGPCKLIEALSIENHYHGEVFISGRSKKPFQFDDELLLEDIGAHVKEGDFREKLRIGIKEEKSKLKWNFTIKKLTFESLKK